jgi:hypothetical protein
MKPLRVTAGVTRARADIKYHAGFMPRPLQRAQAFSPAHETLRFDSGRNELMCPPVPMQDSGKKIRQRNNVLAARIADWEC